MTESDELTLEWFDGEFYPPEEVRALFSIENYPAESAMLIGTEGALLIAHGGEAVLMPEEKFKDNPRTALDEKNHYQPLVNACLGGESTKYNFAQTGPMTEPIFARTTEVQGKRVA